MKASSPSAALNYVKSALMTASVLKPACICFNENTSGCTTHSIKWIIGLVKKKFKARLDYRSNNGTNLYILKWLERITDLYQLGSNGQNITCYLGNIEECCSYLSFYSDVA